MTIEELKIKRVKIRTGHPHSVIKKGQILSLNTRTEGGVMYHMYTAAEPIHIDDKVIADYPDIFLELKWWQERQPEDMPEYLQTGVLVVAKVDKCEFDANGKMVVTVSDEEGIKTISGWELDICLPATENQFKLRKIKI